MANIAKITPRALTRHLNSFRDLGEVMGDNQANRHLSKAGFIIAGDPEGKTINMLKYAAWLFDQIHERESAVTVPRSYDDIKEAARRRSAEASTSGRDIGMIPRVVNPGRREKCKWDLCLFLKTYFPETFKLPWSQDHIDVIRKAETAVRRGGLFSLAMPRGTGKTSMCERIGIYALFYGFRSFATIVGASEEAAGEIREVIKTEIECNELLAEDFPEICYPVRALDGIANRCNGQLCCGQRTRISWSDEIVLPTVEGSAASGATFRFVGITGRIRGMKATRADGTSIRPNFILIDDPQTDESANSPEQNKKRLRILSGAILGLAGPGVKISGIMPCTIIRPGDMADQILNPEKHPEWQGERRKLLITFPDNLDMWNQYKEIWAESLQQNGDISAATDFYRANREAMDKGARVSWPERFEEDEISGIQYAMNIYIRDPETFYAEYQNEPMPDDLGDAEKITVQQIWNRTNNRPRQEIPVAADYVTAFVDVQKNLLYWMVCAWADNFTGWIVDYGAFPDQKRRYFSLKDANPSYASRYPGTGLEGSIYAAVIDLAANLLSRPWLREDGAELRITRALIDSGWGKSTDAVFQACRESDFAAALLPSKGMGITAAQRPFSEYRKNQGDRIGFNWMIPNVRKKRSIRYIMYDTNFWKSFFRERIFTAPGDPGNLTIYGKDEEYHRLLAEHLSSEISEPTAGRGRRVDIWKAIPGRENHWLDCIVGNYVAASEQGCVLRGNEISHNLISHAKRAAAEAPTGPRHFKPGQRFSPGRRFSSN